MPIPGDEFVGGDFRDQKRRKNIGCHDQRSRREAPSTGRSGVQDKPVDREGPAMELPAGIPEAHPLLARGA